MGNNIISELTEILKKEEEKFKNNKISQQLVDANSRYNSLVNNGLIKKRGYTLRGIEDAHLFHVNLNGY